MYIGLSYLNLFFPLIVTALWFLKVSREDVGDIITNELAQSGVAIKIFKDGSNELEKRVLKATNEAKQTLNCKNDISLYIIKEDIFNAFAISNLKKESAIAVYEGLINSTSDEQLKAIIGHEIGHIMNKDSLYKLLHYATQSIMPLIIHYSDLALAYTNKVLINIPYIGLLAVLYRISYHITVWIISAVMKLNSFIQILSYKQSEYLADFMGAKATSSGSMVDTLELIKTMEASIGIEKRTALASLLAEHPSTENRIKNIRKGA
jgi:heat shock protein HtpX